MKPKSTDLLRYALWLGVANTAYANRKYFGLPTTWVFHLTLNSFLLFLPELYRGAANILQLDARAQTNRDFLSATEGKRDFLSATEGKRDFLSATEGKRDFLSATEGKRDFLSAAHGMVEDAVVNNPNYALYVSPVALAYMVSHPNFNIYKGELATLRVLGFGLDALPHSLTAFAFTNLMMDALRAFHEHAPSDAKWSALAARADEHSVMVAGALLLGASAAYEAGEYAIHKEELRETGGDVNKINLVWSAQDTLFDLMANTLGWLAATLLRKRPRRQSRLTMRNDTP